MSNTDTPNTPEVPGASGAPGQSSQLPQTPQPPAHQAPAAPQAPYATPAAQAPQQPQQPQAPQQPQYAPPTQQPAQPLQSQSTPQAPVAPQTPVAPQAPQYAAPQQPQYGAPQAPYAPTPQYGAVQPHAQYAAPQQPAYGSGGSGQPPYGTPGYGAPQYPTGGFNGGPGPGEPFNGAADPDDTSRPLYGASFGQAVKRYFRGYVKFDGRASRSEYWYSVLFTALIALVPGILLMIGFFTALTSPAFLSYDYNYGYLPSGGFFAAPSAGGGLMIFALILSGIIGLALFLPNIAVAWRRLHDGNYAGPLWFLSFIPYLGSLIVLIFMFLPSNPAGRRFDPVRY